VVPDQVCPRFRYQDRQPGDKVLRLEDHVRGAVSIRRLQRVAHLPAFGQRQPLRGDRRPRDIARQMLELLPFRGRGRNARMQREPRALGHIPARGFRIRRQSLQREDLLALPRTRRNPVGDRVPEQGADRRPLVPSNLSIQPSQFPEGLIVGRTSMT
jgi:hypothetical protein